MPNKGKCSPLTARPTVYNGIVMRSRLEAKVAASLDAHRIPWIYEPRAYASPSGQYLPDFQLWPDGDGKHWPATFLEVKGGPSLSVVPQVKARMEIIWASDPAAGLLIDAYTGSGHELWAGGPMVTTPGDYDPAPLDAFPNDPTPWYRPLLGNDGEGAALFICPADNCATCDAWLAKEGM
jgi:hypothetical protein